MVTLKFDQDTRFLVIDNQLGNNKRIVATFSIERVLSITISSGLYFLTNDGDLSFIEIHLQDNNKISMEASIEDCQRIYDTIFPKLIEMAPKSGPDSPGTIPE